MLYKLALILDSYAAFVIFVSKQSDMKTIL